MRKRPIVELPFAVGARSIGVPFLHIPFHAQGSAATKVPNYGNYGPSEFTVGGTATNLWDTSGCITIGTDNFMNISQSPGDYADKYSLITAPHGVLVLASVNVPDLSAAFPLFDTGQGVAGQRGYRYYVGSGEKIVIQAIAVNGTVETGTTADAAVTLNTWQTVLWYMGADKVPRFAQNGGAHNAGTAFAQDSAPPSSTVYVRAFGAASTDATPVTFASHACKVRDLWIITPSSSPSDYLDRLSQEFSQYTQERVLPTWRTSAYVR
jgi:hypothetical protein